MKKTVILYGVSLALIVVILKTIEYKWLLRDISWQLYIFIIAIIFTVLGAWLGNHFFKPNNHKTVTINQQAIKQLKLSKRELEVLRVMCDGASNQQIADQLFISVNTVKTHLKSAFIKLEVENRVTAINRLKQLNIVPQ